jgi:ParB-like nuclease domain
MALRHIELKDIDPSPFRSFRLFPIDDEQVDRLLASINDTGFWGGMQVRPKPGVKGRYELAFGHHRWKAALKAKLDAIAAEVLPLSDDEMIRLLTAENATQRQDSAAATLDAVASICRRISYLLLRCDSWEDFRTIVPKFEDRRWAPDERSFVSQRGRLANGSGIGHDAIGAFAGGSLPERDVRSARATLETSGEFGRIVADQKQRVDTEVAEETRLAEEAAREAERKALAEQTAKAEAAAAAQRKAADEAKAAEVKSKAKTEKTAKNNKGEEIFDVSIGALFKNRHQLDAFRKAVTAEHMRPLVSMKQQRKLALSIVALANKEERDTTAEFIRECIANVAMRGGNINRAAKEYARRMNDSTKTRDAFNHLRYAVSEWGKGIDMLLDVAQRRAQLPAPLEQMFVRHALTIRTQAEALADKMDIDLDDDAPRTIVDGKIARPTLMIEG